jgi:hypothetical protein
MAVHRSQTQGEEHMTNRIEIEYELKAEEDDDIQVYVKPWADLTAEEIEEVERWVEFKEEGSGRIPMGKLVAYISNKLKELNT